MKTLFLVRHGTVHNPQGIAYRRLPGFHLSDKGREEAAQAARFLQAAPLEILFYSPLERAVETAEAIHRLQNAPMLVEERIIEWDVEDTEDVQERMLSFWQEWLRGPHHMAAAVSHRDPLRSLLCALSGVAFTSYPDKDPPHPLSQATVYRVTAEGERVHIERVFTPQT